MVRTAERPLRDERRVLAQFAGHGVYLRRLKTLAEREWGQNGRQTLCHHRFSGTRRTNHYKVMAARGSHFERAFHGFLTAHISEIKVKIALLLVKLPTGVDHRRLKRLRPVKEVYHIHKSFHAIHFEIVHHRSLADVLLRHYQAFIFIGSGLYRDRQRTAHGLQPAVETEFAHEHIVLQPVAFQVLYRRENADSQWQVISAALLLNVSRRQIYSQICHRHLISVVI